MKVVEQARLAFQEGNSDKVYEVDLVEVAAGQHVVNFRYGRRGSALRDGTKTPLPLPLDKARALFNALVAEKTRGGYRPFGTTAPTPSARSTTRALEPEDRDARAAQALLTALRRGQRGPVPLHLVVRKVGERGLQEAEPALLELLAAGAEPVGMKPAVFCHFLLAALARCGSERALPALRKIAADAKAPRHLRDVACLALTMLGGAGERRLARARVPVDLLPDTASGLNARIRAAEVLLVDDPERAHAALFALYISAPASQAAAQAEAEIELLVRRLLLSVVRVARRRGQELGLLRTLNWAAEVRRDGELFALLARRFESSRQDAAPDVMSYFRRRAARVLRRLGSLGSPDYVSMGSELLLTYREEDAEDPVDTEHGSWDAFGRYHALNFVLFGNSTRYARAGHRRATWRCRDGYQPGMSGPAEREESYPALWDRAPEALWRVGVSDSASVVIGFATRALRDQTDYLSQVSDELLASALSRAQPAMRRLAFEVARARMPNLLLARAALASDLDEAGDWVVAWVSGATSLLSTETELLALLITAKSVRVREAAARLARDLVLEGMPGKELVSRSIAILMQLSEEPGANERALAAASFLLARAPQAMQVLSVEVLKDLLAHPLAGVAGLGAELVLQRSRSSKLEEGLLDTLLRSPHSAVRSLGARIVAETPPALLKNEPELLLHFALSDNVELREGTRAALAEVARLYPEVGREVASRLLDALLTAQTAGVPSHVVSVLRHELRAYLPKRDAPAVLALVGALSPHAREAGGLLLGLLGPDDLELEAIVRLANHEILLIRQGAWLLARAAKDRFRIAPVALARLCDARWEDSRQFAFDFVRSFAPADLVPDTVIAICDSVQPMVQSFGQTLLLEHWRDEHAARYLLRLSEHPSANIQLLVSGLLERVARGNLQLLGQLLPCLTTLLSQVNRGGVAKQRVLEFLRGEAVASAEAAALLAPLLERQSLTRAVSHKGPLIATMVDLHARFPDIPVPISTASVPFQPRGGRGV